MFAGSCHCRSDPSFDLYASPRPPPSASFPLSSLPFSFSLYFCFYFSDCFLFPFCTADSDVAVQVTDHARQLMEKHVQKPFFDGGYAGSTPRMSAEEVQEGMAWVDDRFFPIRYEDEALPSVDWVLNVAKAAVLRSPVPDLNYFSWLLHRRADIPKALTFAPWGHGCVVSKLLLVRRSTDILELLNSA